MVQVSSQMPPPPQETLCDNLSQRHLTSSLLVPPFHITYFIFFKAPMSPPHQTLFRLHRILLNLMSSLQDCNFQKDRNRSCVFLTHTTMSDTIPRFGKHGHPICHQLLKPFIPTCLLCILILKGLRGVGSLPLIRCQQYYSDQNLLKSLTCDCFPGFFWHGR